MLKVNGETKLVGILADPIGHVRTPHVLSCSLARQGHNALCVPFHVLPDDLGAVLSSAGQIRNLAGMVVTVPYKERILELCGIVSPQARLIGSANAIRWNREAATWECDNFDGDGLIQNLTDKKVSVAGSHVLLAGAGGAAKSVAVALARNGAASIAIANRTLARAQQFCERLAPEYPETPFRATDRPQGKFDLIVNASSLGMKDDDPLPVPLDVLQPGTRVCEAVMRAGDTELIRMARARGALVEHGQLMLYGQIVRLGAFFSLPIAPENVDRSLGPVLV